VSAISTSVRDVTSVPVRLFLACTLSALASTPRVLTHNPRSSISPVDRDVSYGSSELHAGQMYDDFGIDRRGLAGDHQQVAGEAAERVFNVSLPL
jgi:hypothetical protein